MSAEQARPATVRDLEKLLKSAGFSRREAGAMASAAWAALTVAPAPDADVAAVKDALVSVRERLGAHHDGGFGNERR